MRLIDLGPAESIGIILNNKATVDTMKSSTVWKIRRSEVVAIVPIFQPHLFSIKRLHNPRSRNRRCLYSRYSMRVDS